MDPVRIFFLCVGNTCRSPMAEAIARGLGGEAVEATSAGLTPTGRVAPMAEAAVEALGYSSAGLTSTGLDSVRWDDLDIVVSLIGDHGLVLLPPSAGRVRVSWPIPDPYGEELHTFHTVGRLLDRRIRELFAELEIPVAEANRP